MNDGEEATWALIVAPGRTGVELAAKVSQSLRSRASALHAGSLEEVAGALECVEAGDIGLVVVHSDLGEMDTAIEILDRHPKLARADYLVVTDKDSHTDLSKTVERGNLAAILPEPVTPQTLAVFVHSQLKRWTRRYSGTADMAPPSKERQLQLPEDDLLAGLELEAEELVALLLERIEKVVGPRPRLTMSPGTCLTKQGEESWAVYLVLEGSVTLYRNTSRGEIVMHHQSSGPIIGLVSLAEAQKAYFTSRAATEVTAVRLSMDQIDYVLAEDSVVSAILAVAAIRALTTRLVRAEQLHVENFELSERVEAERIRLEETLEELRQTREDLVASSRFAMLGELSAGIAHELNNPVAALQRAAEYVAIDTRKLLEAHPRGKAALRALDSATDRIPLSTSGERALIGELSTKPKYAERVRRLVRAGITDREEILALVGQKETAFLMAEQAARVGASAHNIAVASSRISDLVGSLRAYARPGQAAKPGVEVIKTIEDTIVMVAHRLRGINIRREFEPVGQIRAHAGQLGQVWTNLLVNAADALEGSGNIEVGVRGIAAGSATAFSGEGIEVTISDDGPGIPPEIQQRVFEPRFSTKDGQVRFGLGIGLGIAKQIVEAHGGSMALESDGAGTCFTVEIPACGPPEKEVNK